MLRAANYPKPKPPPMHLMAPPKFWQAAQPATQPATAAALAQARAPELKTPPSSKQGPEFYVPKPNVVPVKSPPQADVAKKPAPALPVKAIPEQLRASIAQAQSAQTFAKMAAPAPPPPRPPPPPPPVPKEQWHAGPPPPPRAAVSDFGFNYYGLRHPKP